MKKQTIAGFSAWCAATIFLGAFLLFQVQPIISKMILPWFGGSPAVWTVCLLFFQVALLGGYAYADLLARVEQPLRQATIHLVLVIVAVLTLPITPAADWKPSGIAHPTVHILLLLAVSVGLPYFLLSATSPLVQAWFARVYADRSPYRLYALSNIGSLLALLSYPFFLEPSLTTSMQGNVWSVAFIVFGLSCAWLTMKLWRAGPLRTAAHSESEDSPPKNDSSPSWITRLSWVGLPALGSVLLLAVTNHLCQDVAVVPLLWIAPLSLYLLTFIICFDREAWYVRRWFALAGVVSVLAASYLSLAPFLKYYFQEHGYGWRWTYITKHVLLHIPVYLVALFCLCMVCHGELVRRKPHARRLTSFYLSVAAGGALGGLLVALVCPLVFSTFFELNLALILGCLVALAALVVEVKRQWWSGMTFLMQSVAVLAGVIVPGIVIWTQLETRDYEPGLARARNFYGVLSVKERYPEEPEVHGLALFHGGTLHGYQLLADDKQEVPTSYYTEHSGVGKTLLNFREGSPLRVGAVGLGVGTIAAYAKEADCFRFYEINPLVIQLAEKHFTFLKDARERRSQIQIEEGDARLCLEREEPQNFDVLVLDAFSGDTIPVHLLSREAFDVYLRHLKPDGVIAVHVSSRYVNLIPVVLRIGHHFDLKTALVHSEKENKLAVAPCDWILLTNNNRFLQKGAVAEASQMMAADETFPLWTDQYNNLFKILH